MPGNSQDRARGRINDRGRLEVYQASGVNLNVFGWMVPPNVWIELPVEVEQGFAAAGIAVELDSDGFVMFVGDDPPSREAT